MTPDRGPTVAAYEAARHRVDVVSTSILAVGGVGGVVIARLLSPDTIDDGPVICPFRRLTGLPCPGCGLTRSWVYAAHGWWRESLLANPFGMIAMALVLLLAAALVVSLVRGGPAPSAERLAAGRPARLLIAAWVVFGVARIAVDA